MIWKWDDLRQKIGPGWQSGFDVYDGLETDSSALRQLQSWNDFETMCQLLIEQLKIASRSTPREWEAEEERDRLVIEMRRTG